MYLKTIFTIISFLFTYTLQAGPSYLKKPMNILSTYRSNIGNLCSVDYYQKKDGETSQLMNKVISATNNKSKYKYSQGENTDTMLNPDLNWKRAETGAPILRGGKDIFSAMSSLIASAEKEVLIQTFIFDFASSVAQDYVFKGIIELYNKHKAKMDKGLAKDPVVVRLVFDVIGGFKGLNFNEIFINTRFAGGAIKHWKNISSSRASFGEDPDYEIQFPTKPVLDPKVLRFEIKGHRHDVFPNMVNVNHSKSIAVDRTVAIVTGANIIDYHLTNEYKTPQNKELMVDHGFYVFDSAALMVADDFYNLWYKDEKSHRKWSGWSSQYNGNVEVDRYLKYDGRPFVGLSGSAKKNGRVNLIKRKFINKDWDSSISKKILIGVVGRDAGKGNKYPKSPQNDAFLAILKNAKSHVNIISPSLNSLELMNAIIDAVERGVNINFLLSQNYQDYNWYVQEGGSNQMAIDKIFKEINKRKKRHPLKAQNFGQFNVRWFVTRGGNTSGRKRNEPFKFKTRITEKFWNHNHTKYLSADNQITMVGSANFDEQSWYNSREFNMVFDDHEMSEKWCKNVFGIDFLRANRYGSKLASGERCTINSDCNEEIGLFCNNNFFKNPWIKNWRCVPRSNKGLGGSYCEDNNQCKSRVCQKNKCK